MTRIDTKAPLAFASREEAEKHRDALVAEAETIQLQLSDKNYTHNGQRLDSHTYHEWRRRALGKLGALRTEIRRVKAWMRDEHNRPTVAVLASTTTADELLRRVYDLAYDLAREVDLDPEDWGILDAARAYLASRSIEEQKS